MPICVNCGQSIGDTAFCPNCGAPQAGGQSSQPETVSYDQSVAGQYDQQPIYDQPIGTDQPVGYSQQPVYAQGAPVNPLDTGSFGWAVLGFFIPLVGLILFLVWKDTKPLSAKKAGMGALVGVIVSVVLSIVTTCAGVMLMGASGYLD